jgi:23S rRNA (uracil1939-C5)-methyltransferase
VIESLAAGGDAVARDGGKVVFVAGGAPGDRVRARVVEDHAGWARAALVEVVAPGPARVVPRCPLAAAATCGGCAWQHVARDAQLAAKQAIVAGALRALVAAGLELAPIVAAAPDAGWRRRARLHWVRAGARPFGSAQDRPATIGFYAPRSHRVTDVPTCPQLEPVLDAALAEVRGLAAGLGSRGELHLARGAGPDVHVVIDGACDEVAASALVGRAGIAGVTLRAGGARRAGAARTFGAATVEIDEAIAGAADDFAQASADGNRALGVEVAALLGPGDGRALLELYAGAGNLTRHARALGWQVTATDVVAPARSPDGVETITGPAADVVAALVTAGRRYDAVLLDPPRAGARDVVGLLAATGATRIVYVSCDPATLARDVQVLVGDGFTATRARALDLMPDTAHVEVVVLLERAAGV